LAEALALLRQQIGSKRATVAAAIPTCWCHCRMVAFPYRAPTRVAKTLRYALETRLPRPGEEYVIEPLAEWQPAGVGGTRTLVAACQNTSVQRVVSILQQAGLDPCIIQPSILAVARFLRTQQHPSATTRLVLRVTRQAAEVALDEHSGVIACRTIVAPGLPNGDTGKVAEKLAAQVIFAVKSWELERPLQGWEQTVVLCSPEMRDAFIRALRFRLNFSGEVLAGADGDERWAAAWGVATEAVLRRHRAPNLRQGTCAYLPYARRRERMGAAAVVLLAAIGVTAVIGAARAIGAEKQALHRLMEQQRKTFSQVVSSSRVPPSVDAMEAALLKARKEYRAAGEAISALGVWHEVVSLVPANSEISFDEIDISPRRVRLRGRAPRADMVWSFHERLRSSVLFSPNSPVVTRGGERSAVAFEMELRYRQ